MPNIPKTRLFDVNKPMRSIGFWVVLGLLALVLSIFLDNKYSQPKREPLPVSATPTVEADAAETIEQNRASASNNADNNSAKVASSAAKPRAQLQLLFDKLKLIRDSGVKELSEAQLSALWQEIDENIANKKIYPMRALQLKKWLAGLGEHPKFMQQIEDDYKKISADILSDIAKENKRNEEDVKFKEYKRREQELVQKLTQQYPDNPDLVNEKLQQQLDKIRSEIWQ